MIKKYFAPIFWILFISIFSYFFWWEYLEFHQENNQLQLQNQQVDSQIKNFQLSDIRLLKDTSLTYTPNLELLNQILKKIDSAQERIYIEVYILTETRIKESIKKAKQNGVDVKIILEKNPYKAANINNKTYDFFKKNQIDIVWSNPKNYSLNHSKVIIIDDEAIISTWNLSYSTFKFNRDFFIFTHDEKIISSLKKIFEADFNWIKQDVYGSNLVLSPNYSRDKLTILLNNAKSEIKLYFQYFKDEELEELLIKKAQEWIKISAIISKTSWENDKEKVEKFQSSWIDVTPLKNEKMHAKMILIDHKYLYIWSINFSNYSFDFNREVGILIKNKEIITKIFSIFTQDKNEYIKSIK